MPKSNHTISKHIHYTSADAAREAAKHWVAYSVLETKLDGALLPRILTPSQYRTAMQMEYQTVPVNLLAGKNYKEIKVFDTPFTF